MPRAYSNDLRRKFLQAYDEGEDTLEELAEQFRVSLGWAKKISARRTRTGEVEAPVWRHGPVSRVTAEVQEWIRRQIRAQPDTTLQELCDQLEKAKHVRLSMGRMWLALRQLGLPLKKKRSTHKSKIVKPRSAAAKSGEKP
jgi:transposase